MNSVEFLNLKFVMLNENKNFNLLFLETDEKCNPLYKGLSVVTQSIQSRSFNKIIDNNYDKMVPLWF